MAVHLTVLLPGRVAFWHFASASLFFGQMTIPQMAVAAIYGTVRPGQYSSEPMAKVFVEGTITVPQSCEINAGEVISVDFGTIFAKNFATRGHKPEGFVDKKNNHCLYL
ncbi:hypothetical protein QBS63_04000 [Cronobacter sakazakii]|nr:hypothetical protein [Cronobacter sakazakii]MDQ9204277.1 hypothetical protein [Cronobacter sakazakii]